MPDGSRRLDVRLTLKTDDGALIYMSYNVVILNTQASHDKQMKGEVVTLKDRYCISAPTFRTSHPKYAWLAETQAIGKVRRFRDQVMQAPPAGLAHLRRQ